MRTRLTPGLMALLALGCVSDTTLKGGYGEEFEPDIVVSPPQLLYENVPLGDTEVQAFTVTNNGNALLYVDEVRLGEVGAFTVLTAEFPMAVDPGATAEVEVAYTPISDSDVGRAWVASNDPDTPEATVELIGTSGSPSLQIDPTSWDFGTLPVLCSDSVEITLTNVGNADLTIDQILETGEAFDLSTDVELPMTLAPGISTVVDVTFAPLEARSFEGELWVSSNDPAGDKRATQTGNGNDEGVCLNVGEGEEVLLPMDFEVEYKVADVAFLLDTTCSMSGLATAMADEFAAISGALAGIVPDITFGAATFDDYNYGSMGGGNDKPFILMTQQTSDLARMQAALNAVSIHNGGDTTESTIEALYQGATGMGYDQDCDGTYDTVPDVYPFIANSADAFSGSEPGVYDPTVEDTGTRGGFGFRENVLPIFVYATDADLRDSDGSYATPGGCNLDAGMSHAVEGITSLSGKAIGIVVNSPTTSLAGQQMTEIAELTGSYGDMDGDGLTEPAVISWTGTSGDFRAALIDAIQGLVGEGEFDEVRLEVDGEDYGLVESITPEAYYNVESGEEVHFDIDFFGAVPSEESDQTVPIHFELLGFVDDEELILDQFYVYVLVPGGL
jgi:hypothetical protein